MESSSKWTKWEPTFELMFKGRFLYQKWYRTRIIDRECKVQAQWRPVKGQPEATDMFSATEKGMS